ncbi:MAG: TetR/AcrR family transcriptional regulator [Candidatus Pedobacter colombiensis]|uniref:TetR/AcrR family transcriptional regulator n=1 Tax=Candidatus Pedobacter colombiensis TaxID=3121371 RepID=A0AAJ6B6T0_9SPHI|nr:TetR/AcrR family transcriptional regulator [Pedobacter sp.]WEK18796.1 MAG: TetR/AcrR family transcriptional regulator [Pedobacter sp.]
MVETDKKRETIIEGAIKRFIHYGISKTTMNEIAEDLSVSKPSLYYYFPDKSSLVLGVIEKIFNDYFEYLEQGKTADISLMDCMNNFVEIRHRFFQKYYMLHLSSGTPDSSLNSDELKKSVMKMHTRNIQFHADLFQTAVDKNEIAPTDVYKTAELYLDCLAGITSLCIMHGNKELFPSKKEMKNILERQLSLSNIFIKGLKNQ